MVTQEQAEEMAKDFIEKYLNACQLETNQDGAKALMKLMSVAGVVMVATVGYDEAVDRMYSTAAFIEKKLVGVKFVQQTVN